MRVISQKGMPVVIDLPYERIGVSQSYKEPNNIIGFDLRAKDDDVFYLATYSTLEKAEKAMRELHDNYSYLWKIEHGLVSYYADETIAFRFPQEDEI